jgi:Predicted membrane protein
LVINGINNNDTLRETIDKSVIGGVESIVAQYGDRVGSLIYDTMEGWETKDMVDKLEVQVGADLQYIRINGTVIGGLAGLAIHLLSQLF